MKFLSIVSIFCDSFVNFKNCASFFNTSLEKDHESLFFINLEQLGLVSEIGEFIALIHSMIHSIFSFIIVFSTTFKLEDLYEKRLSNKYNYLKATTI